MSLFLQLAISFHKDHLEKKNAVHMQLSLSEWTQLKQLDRNEYVLHGKRFDVFQKDIKNGVVHVVGCYDEEEEGLVKTIHQLWNKKQSSTSFFSFLYFEKLPSITFHSFCDVYTETICCYTEQLTQGVPHVETPPPNFI